MAIDGGIHVGIDRGGWEIAITVAHVTLDIVVGRGNRVKGRGRVTGAIFGGAVIDLGLEGGGGQNS